MKEDSLQCAVVFLQTLVGQPLRYGLKSPDTELYDFGFGELFEDVSKYGKKRKICTFILHALCNFKVIWRSGERRIDKYYGDTPSEKFHGDIKRLIGSCVKRVALSEENDLWLDLGDFWIVFETFEDGKESWRFFTSDINQAHLVASNSWIKF